MDQVKIGDKVGYDACPGDVVEMEGTTDAFKVQSTCPSGCLLESLDTMEQFFLLYKTMADRGATYLRLRTKASLPICPGLL
jgi:hypothetical protein